MTGGVSTGPETRKMLVRLLQLAYSGEKAAALAYQGHARSVRDPDEKAMIAKIENDEWIHRRKVGALLDRLGARPLAVREARASAVGHTLSVLCSLAGWFLPMFLAGRLETRNVCEYEKAAGWAAELHLDDFLADLREMAAVEVEHEKYFHEVIGRNAPERRPQS
ncbi:MAG: ferritin-like domain-containing protein [Acidobacteriota bacterium]|nr:ferritin-like domain-containing protein [Acidobacteriota bacterium]